MAMGSERPTSVSGLRLSLMVYDLCFCHKEETKLDFIRFWVTVFFLLLGATYRGFSNAPLLLNVRTDERPTTHENTRRLLWRNLGKIYDLV